MMKKLNISAVFVLFPCILAVYGIFSKKYDTVSNSLYTILWLAIFMIIHKKTHFLTKKTYYCILTFILLSVFAGRSLGFYKLIPRWDKVLHFLSGFVIVSAGKQLYQKLNGDKSNKKLLNLFSTAFAVAMAGLWEIIEFCSDSFFGTISQNNSLSDTMWDIIAGSVSALIAVFFV